MKISSVSMFAGAEECVVLLAIWEKGTAQQSQSQKDDYLAEHDIDGLVFEC